MAQIGDIFEIVDEEMDADRVRRRWLKYRGVLIGGLVLLFAGLFAYVGWESWRERVDQQASDLFLTAWNGYEKADATVNRAELERLLATYPRHGYALLGRLLQAREMVREGQVDRALMLLQEAAAEAGRDAPLADYAWLNAAYLTAAEPARCLGFLDRIGEGSAFRGHALELKGLLSDHEGKAEEALKWYREALEKSRAGGLRERLSRRVERLGGAAG
ncbi:MAG: tetratricopeptide repeat protein [Magnetococcales bacterium]|nr:tetratricopeptide repeat protein [Magnetococcales bacterium]